MPNLCENNLTLYGPREVLDELAATGLSLRVLLPWPRDMDNVMGDKRLQENWAANRWGTRQDIGPLKGLAVEGPFGHDGHFEMKVAFKSVWGPPVKAFESLYERYKSRGLEVWLEYIEPECQFMGVVTTRAGEFMDEQRGYDSTDELDEFSKELDHALGAREASYQRLLDNEEKRTKPKKPKAPKAAPLPKPAPPPKPVREKPAPPMREVPTGMTGTLDSLMPPVLQEMMKPGKRPEPKVTPKPTPVAVKPPEPPKKPVAPKPPPKIETAPKPVHPAIELSRRVKEKLDALPRLRIDSMMLPKNQRPPAPPKPVTSEKAHEAEEKPMKVPAKSSAPTPKAAATAKTPAAPKKEAAKTSPKPPAKPAVKAAAKPAVKAAAKPAVTKAAAPKAAATKAAPKKPDAAKAPVKKAAAPKAAPVKAPVKAPAPKKAPAKKAAPAPKKPVAEQAPAPKPAAAPASKAAKSSKAPEAVSTKADVFVAVKVAKPKK